MKIRFVVIYVLLLLAFGVSAQQKPLLPETGGIRFAEAFKIGEKPSVKSVTLRTGVKLQYAEQGNATGIPVILLHGYTDSWRSFELVLPHLPKTIHAFALSQRGHGSSECPASGYRPNDFSADVAAFMDVLKLKRAVIVGHSMGSQVALRFVLDHPERASGLLLVQQSTLHKPIPATFLDAAVQESAKVSAHVWRSALAGLMETDFSSEISQIKLPTLIVWGDQDLFCSRKDQDFLTTAIKSAKLLIYSGTGHAPHWEEPERFAADVTSFVEKLTH